MKNLALLLFFLLGIPAAVLGGDTATDDLLRTLDAAIADKNAFTDTKKAKIENLLKKRAEAQTPEESYRINQQLIDNYESFVCDSAEYYILQNIRLARGLANPDYLAESRLQLAFVYSLSGLFLQAEDIFASIEYDQLDDDQKCHFYWNRIRFYENLINYTNDRQLVDGYREQISLCRDSLLTLLPAGSKEWLTEKAFKAQETGNPEDAIDIFDGIFRQQQPDTHQYAMAAMCLAKVYGQTGDKARQEHFLILAATTDIRLAVKENEALLALATHLFEKGDIDRSYSYITSALSDANFYNSRFKNTVIARLYPIIESNYLYRIEKQKQNLRTSAILLSVFIALLIVTLSIIAFQMRTVSRTRKNLWLMNQQLNEANLIKEKYIGYFMNRCALATTKLYTYRKDVNHKIKSGQIDRLYKTPTDELEKEFEELYTEFDEAFLKLYPDFVDEFNSLLKPEARYETDGDRLTTELRIFALMRLGITNVNQIAEFLRCSLQTVYNYKSKMKSKARGDIANFEEAVKKLGLTVSRGDSTEFTKTASGK